MNEKDNAFLDKTSKLLDPSKWAEFLLTWARALESYGTPREFAEAAKYKKKEIEFNGNKYTFMYTISENYEQRIDLMKKQEDYHARSEIKKYGVLLDFWNCFLCQNVIQAIDTQKFANVKNNVMYDFKTHFILPNRYPGQFGHSLSVPKNHDDITNRVPYVQDTENRATIYRQEAGKTRGNILSKDYLDAIIESCDKLNLVGLRNHVLDGMSIPAHDHFHLIPEDLPSVSLIEEIIGKKQRTDYGSTIWTPENTPFDTLIISKALGKSISEVAHPILKELELNNEVFTLIYNNGNLLISPRFKSEVNDRRQQIGGGISVHYFDTEGQEFIDQVNRVVPMNGNYGWARFIK